MIARAKFVPVDAGLARYAGATLTLDTRDTDLYFKRVDRLRAGFIAALRKVWYADFNKENTALLKSVNGQTDPIGWRNAIERQVRNYYFMDATYERQYLTVHPVFAERVYDSLTGNKTGGMGYEQKADPELIAIWQAAALEFIRTEGADLITSVQLVSHQQVVFHTRRLVEMAIAGSWSMNRLKLELASKLISISDSRARTISRTETGRSANLGSRAGAVASGLNPEKEWLTGPSGTGDRHATTDYPGLDGQVKGLDELYEVGVYTALYPLDLRLPASESINCRCSEAYLPT